MEERHLSLSEAADALDISERTAYRWIKSGKLRAYKPGRDYWIPESAVKEVVEESKVRPKAPSRSSLEPSLFNGIEEERRMVSLRNQITFVSDLAAYAEQEIEEREREPESKSSLGRKTKWVINANWALAMMEVGSKLVDAFAEDPNLKNHVYDSGEFLELYRAHMRFHDAIDRTRTWFSGDEEVSNLVVVEKWNRTTESLERLGA